MSATTQSVEPHFDPWTAPCLTKYPSPLGTLRHLLSLEDVVLVLCQ